MTNSKKYLFPKIKKKLKGFLTDESGKITKKDALGLSAGVMLLSGIDEVAAASVTCSSPSVNHVNVLKNGHYNYHPSGSSTPHCSGSGNNGSSMSCSVTSHASGIVNGHYSGSPSGTATPHGHCSHSSSGSGSGSGGSCSGGCSSGSSCGCGDGGPD